MPSSVVRADSGDSRDEAGSRERGTDGRPQRVKLSEARSGSERPHRRMPPLMLVSEQRVDDPAEEMVRADMSRPVRPRRVIRAADAPDGVVADGDDDGGQDFRSYARRHDAVELPDLLEASLAYGLYVEGDEFNSRPRIMTRILRFDPENPIAREDALRAFGVLLREERIVKLKRGQFVLPAGNRFRPDEGDDRAASNG